MDQKRQPQTSGHEEEQQEKIKTGYGQEEIQMLKATAKELQKEGADVEPERPILKEARTPKERIATAIDQSTPSHSGKGSHGVHRIH